MSYTYEKQDYELLEAGDYEVTLEEFAKKVIPTSGTEKISVRYRIRDDVEQANKGRIVFEDIWKEKENPQYFNRKRINKLLGTQTIDDGHVFEDIDAIGKFLVGSNLIIHVTKDFDEYVGADRNKVSYYKPTKNGAKAIGATAPAKREDAPLDIEDTELPF